MKTIYLWERKNNGEAITVKKQDNETFSFSAEHQMDYFGSTTMHNMTLDDLKVLRDNLQTYIRQNDTNYRRFRLTIAHGPGHQSKSQVECDIPIWYGWSINDIMQYANEEDVIPAYFSYSTITNIEVEEAGIYKPYQDVGDKIKQEQYG